MKKIIFLGYSTFLLIVTLFSYLFIDANLQYLNPLYTGFATSYRGEATALYCLMIIIFIFFYIYFINLSINRKVNKKDIITILSLTVLILYLSYPGMLSYDIFNYIATAKVTFFYQENPYIIMPIDFLGDPLLQFMHAANKTALYGPFWIAITGIPFIFGLGNFLLTLFFFKLLTVFFYVLTVYVLFKLTNDHLSVVLFALNPLVVIETLISSHNDIVMVSLVLLAFYLIKNKRLLLGMMIFTLSIFIKFATIFLIPVFFYIFYKYVRKKNIDWEKIYLYSFYSMIVIFFLSPIREEIYPWYAIWFLSLICLIHYYKRLLYFSLILSFGLLFRYTPYMYRGIYDQQTTTIKWVVTFLPILFYGIYVFFIKNKIKK